MNWNILNRGMVLANIFVRVRFALHFLFLIWPITFMVRQNPPLRFGPSKCRSVKIHPYDLVRQNPGPSKSTLAIWSVKIQSFKFSHPFETPDSNNLLRHRTHSCTSQCQSASSYQQRKLLVTVYTGLMYHCSILFSSINPTSIGSYDL